MISKYFKIHELVPRNLYEIAHEDLLWNMVPDELIISIDKLKEKFPDGSMTINNYKWNGDREWSGLRTKDSSYYSRTSQHSIMNAFDAVFSKYNPDIVRQYILDNQDEFPYIGGIENFNGMSWVHADIRPRRNGKVIVFGK